MPKLSYQLYSSRNWSLAETFEMLGQAGYREVEGYGALLADPGPVIGALNATGLRMTTAHIALEDLEADGDAIVRLAIRLGLEAVFVPFLAATDRPADPAGWEALAARVAAAGAPLRAAGLGFGWHNHDFELAHFPDGAMPLDAFADAGLSLELDIGWVARAGQDPVSIIERYGRKITVAHVKDLAPPGGNAAEDGWADVGHGVVDWAKVHAALAAAGVGRYVIEHDNPNDHGRFATRSLASAKRLSRV